MERAQETQDLVAGRGQRIPLVNRQKLVVSLTPQINGWN